MKDFKTKLCPACKNVIPVEEDCCHFCGQNLNVVSFEDQRVLYIQTNVEKYIEKFTKLESKSNKTGWNWCSFLFGPAWMIYRKMYGYAAFFYFAPFILELILLVISPSELFYASTNLICNLTLAVCGGLYGDYWYKLKIDKLMREGMNLHGEAKVQHLKKGGTDFTLLGILMVISFMIEVIFGI